MPKQYTETRYALKLVSTNDKGETTEEIKQMKEDAAQKVLAAAKAAGQPEPEVIKMQTFQYAEVESDADFVALVPDESVRVDIINRGVVLKQQGEIRDFMLGDDAAVDGIYDLAPGLAEKTERRKATPAEKALKALSALPAEEIAKILAQFQTASAA